MLTVKDVAEQLKISEQHVRNLIRSNDLIGTRVGRQWIVHAEDLATYLKKINYHPSPIDHPRKKSSIPAIKALSFFSGAMGLDLGLEKAGIHIISACEFDKACRKTIEANRPDMALLGDIWDYSAEDIRNAAGLTTKDDIELIVGGPPCQSFSTAGARRGFKDERGNSFLKFISIILELRPRYAVIENVRGLLSAPISHRPHSERGDDCPSLETEELPGGALLYIVKMLREAGYGVSFNLYNSANFGSPQIRERVVIICNREGKKVPYLTPTHSQDGNYGLPKWRTFREAVEGLEDQTHHHVNFPEARLQYYRILKPGQYWKHLPEELQKQAMGKSYYSGGGKTGFLRRLDWDKPSPTLVTHPAMPATDLAHPVENRPLSIEEYKRIQEFPDDWIVCGSILDQYKQIGNAVPSSLGEAIGKTILSHMAGQTENNFQGFNYSRYKNTDDISWEKMINNLLNPAEICV
ncbi:TPA: DNA cytosine methyltransferase [Legionella pneumophila]|nr:DNA cytosine methyltransferase [Legionella pneumophila]HDO8078943.1 DNA cytosine methyltransferase [Legionella pneumophila]HDO8153381.1 DNA cytosine methyltransferase [Legionella pneumophila]